MCVPESALINDYGKEAALDGCRAAQHDGMTVRYCVCRSPQCNRPSVEEQVNSCHMS